MCSHEYHELFIVFEIGILAELKLASVAELGKTTPQTAPTWASICAYYVSVQLISD